MPPRFGFTPRLFVLAVLSAFGCSVGSATDNDACGQDSDCPSGQVCVVDLDINRTYCAALCTREADCAPNQECKQGRAFDSSDAPMTSVCIDRVRMCLDTERCNGLDDDCDGSIDEDCEVITGCLDDSVCGAFVCSAPQNQPDAICVPPISPAPVPDFTACNADDQCRSNICDTGLCSPLCRFPSSIDEPPCPIDFTCTEAITDNTRPRHNECQRNCLTDSDCNNGQACVWRPVFEARDEHQYVCATLPAGRKMPGEPCTANTLAGDAECAHGLCFGLICTVPCGGPGDVATCGPLNARCATQQLRYGVSAEFTVDVCVR